MSARYPSYEMFGFKVTPTTEEQQLELIASNVKARKQCVLAHLNVHGLHVLHHDLAMSQLHRSASTYVSIDGMPLIPLCRLAGIRASREHRVALLDFIWPLLALAESKSWRVYFLGGSGQVLAGAMRAIHERCPALQFRAHHGYIGVDSADVITGITEFHTDIVIVGMGMPLQERWILRNMDAIAPACVMPVGALFEFLAGTVRTPPRWMGPLGIEWTFRFLGNPRRFWYRYLIEPWEVAWILASGVSRKRVKVVG